MTAQDGVWVAGGVLLLLVIVLLVRRAIKDVQGRKP